MRMKFSLVVLLGLVASCAFASNSTPVVAYTFICNGNSSLDEGPCPNGANPGALIQGTDGNFYGTAQVSGGGGPNTGGGTVFSLTPAGKFTLLHTFVLGPDKNYPGGDVPGLITEGPDGKLYGTTLYGGVGGANGPDGYGVLYRVNRNGTGFRVIHEFCSETNCTDGAGGYALVNGTDGNLYGTTYYGGTNGGGTIFRVTPSTGAYEVVFNFDFLSTGEEPSALTVAPDGTFYGLSVNEAGRVIFHYTESTGNLTTGAVNFPLFNGLPSIPQTGLTFGPNGDVYGLYFIYGESGIGLFEVDLDGSNLQLFPFFNTIDGGGAPGGMILASDGNFWLPEYSGSTSYGDIIALSPDDGSLLQTLTPFSSKAAVGAFPAEIIETKDGILWGSTNDFGTYTTGHFAEGTVFSLNAGLPPR